MSVSYDDKRGMKRGVKGWRQVLAQLVSIHLILPVRGGHHPAEYTARGAAFGIFVALSPTIGAQIPLLGVLWLLLHKFLPQYKFNMVAAAAWTLTTNFLTAPPLFYLYVVTGRFLLGRWEAIRGYQVYNQRYGASQSELEQVWSLLKHDPLALFEKFGIPLMIGWIPWAVLGAWLGYFWVYRLVLRLRAKGRDQPSKVS